MKNKVLEKILLKNSLNPTIDLIEKCENGYFTEVRVTKQEGITHNEKLDKRVINYLKKLHVKVVFITDEEYYKNHNKFYEPPKSCESNIHQIVSKKLKAKEKVEMLEELSMKGETVNRFKVDESSYVACPGCNHILKL